MTYKVVHYNPVATKTPHWRDFRARKLPMPAGWAFLVEAETEMPHLETTLFLAKAAKKAARKRGRRSSGNTPYTYAGELKPFLEYLQSLSLSWGEADPEVFFSYVDRLCERRHWFTGEELDQETLARRVRRVIQAYAYTNKQGLSDVEIDGDDLLAELWEAIDAEAEQGLRGARRNSIRNIGDEEWRAIAGALGPLPSELPERSGGEGGGRRPSGRNRLMAELAITTGMRGGELAALPLAPFLGVVVDDGNLAAWTKVLITETKGGGERNVFVANALVREIQTYAAAARAADVKAGRDRGNRDPGTVFVNGADTGRQAGRFMRAQQLSTIFRDAVRTALPTETIRIVDEDGERFHDRPRFRLHDCRHSFALRLFTKLIGMGREPWDIIQGRLGHRHVATTRDIYLDMSRTSEPYAGDLVAAGMDALIYG